MTAEYSPFARPTFTADDFARNEENARLREATRPRAPIEEPRSFMSDDTARADLIGQDPVMEAELAREDEMLLDRPAEAEAPMFAAAPIYAGQTKARSAATGRRVPAAALIAIPAVVLLAGVGYMALSTGGPEQGIAQKAPGASDTVAAAPAAPAFSEPTELAAVAPVTPVTPVAETVSPPRTTARVETAPTRVARARPAPATAAAASSAGVDASATLPTAPVPYSGSAQTSAPAATVAPPTIVVPPVTAEPVNPTPPATTAAPEPLTPQTSMPEASEPPPL